MGPPTQAALSSIWNEWARKKAIRGVKTVYNELLRTSPHDGIPGLPGDSLPLDDDYLPPAPSPSSKDLSEHLQAVRLKIEASAAEPTPSVPQQSPSDQVVKLGIVGAGAAGLFTAMVLDYLNVQLQGRLHFEYEILEANSEERLGGRLYTYDFGGARDRHDYYDVGAMRFPKNPVMTRTFDLFSKLDMEITDLSPDAPDGSIIPYYMNNGATAELIEPWRYNDKNQWGGSYNAVQISSGSEDPFDFGKALNIPSDIILHSPDDIINASIKPLRDAFIQNPGSPKNWEILMQYDALSTRQVLGMTPPSESTQPENPPPPPPPPAIPPPPYNLDTIQWMETFNVGTSMYDQAHSETVLDSLAFEYDDHTKWYCILGGAQWLARKMCANISHKPIYDSPVTAIRAKGDMEVELDVGSKTEQTKTTKTFNAVVNTTTLGCLNTMDISQAGLNPSARLACRTLGYGASAKIAIKFKRAWWIHDLGDQHSIKKGGLGHSDLTIRTCVYPSYNINDSADGTAVLLCSYTWERDALRLSSLITTNGRHEGRAQSEAQLKDLLIRELARLHENSEIEPDDLYNLIRDNYLEHHAFDWYKEPTTMGAFAFFGPGQFSTLWGELIQPSGDVVIVGEAASPHHAWVVGSLESVVHGLHSWMAGNRGKIEGFEEAMAILERPEAGNPFTGLPPYMDPNISRWDGFLGQASREARQIHGRTAAGASAKAP